MNPFRSLLPSSFTTAKQAAEPAVAAESPVADKSARDAIVEMLELEGCKPKIDSDGDVVFRHKDFTFVLIFSARDTEYLRLLLPNFWSIDSEGELKAAYMAANFANATCKAAKVYVDVEHKQTSCAIEFFTASHQQIVPVLLRSAGALANAVTTFGVACAAMQRGL